MNIIKQLGHIAVGTRFRILTDRLMQDADKVYKSLGLEFEPRWFTVFYLINQQKQITISELAGQLGYSQPAVTQIVNSLIQKKIVKSIKGKDDSRKRVITITPKGEDLLLKLIPVWQDIENAVKELLSSTGYDVLHILGKLESELDSKSIHARVMEKVKNRQRSEVVIKDFDPKQKKIFRDLNYEWISKYFKIEDKDRKLLENPGREIIKKGGFILFAEYENEIAGTVALIRHSDKEYELAKMAVTEKAQGKQIGKKIALAAIERIKSLNAETLFLETNSSLLPAMNLYKNLGFQEVEMKRKSEYERATLRMELDLKKKKNKVLSAG
ncbi:MAG TPA: helix-turn-helix domain-containing GNAT family N-acetyltransferase [Ignavibacteria bacterium]|nr:helix-turn-helix domain-containing GNAT family N-acetyltransferase [Ignavibacteria bacterium]